MIFIKNKAAIVKIKEAGRLLANIMLEISEIIKEGISTLELDRVIEEKMRAVGLVPECKGYGTYRHASCISVNDVVIHGVPSEKVILKNGDLVKIDVVGSFGGYCADMARYYFVGQPSNTAKKITFVAQKALDEALVMVRPGIKLSDISSTIQNIVEEEGFGVVRQFAGHGIGKSIHEEPEIPNYGKPGEGPILRSGMVLCIEPMITERGYELKIDPDGWTARTVDGGLGGHVEDTVVVTQSGCEIVTRV